ncbi:dihydrofolate reductase, partial [uncultured Muribaculum sp.]
YNAPGIEIAPSLNEAINMTATSDEAMIIGGGEIYRQAMPHASRIYLTQIDADAPDADTRFPEIDAAQWDVTQQSEAATDPRSGVNYRFVTLDRK